MARKKPRPEVEPEVEIPPPKPKAKPKWEPGKRPVRFTEGEFAYISRTGLKSAKFKAVFEDDPEGCYGFGTTKESARAMLYDYAEDHGEPT